MLFLAFWRLHGQCAVYKIAQNAISWPLEIAQSLRAGSKCHILAFRDCAVISRSFRGGSKSHIWAFGDCAVIARCLRMLKMLSLDL